jgi:glycosyltransferase involved in cell wall biosynthesis
MKNHFTILIPSYNNIQWIERCIDSALSQKYENKTINFIDAYSDDGSYDLVIKNYFKYINEKDRLNIGRNYPRKYQIENFLIGTRNAKDGSIIVTLDGDDWLKHDRVLDILNEVYTDDVWMTYGSYENDDGTRGIIGHYNDDTIRNNNFRNSSWYASHLRTFRKELFLKIKDEDLRDESGEYYKVTGDLVMEFPMLEMSGFHSKHIDEILYVYNRHNPISDSNIQREIQYELDLKIRKKIPYNRLEKL